MGNAYFWTNSEVISTRRLSPFLQPRVENATRRVARSLWPWTTRVWPRAIRMLFADPSVGAFWAVVPTPQAKLHINRVSDDRVLRHALKDATLLFGRPVIENFSERTMP